ncbi:unnamed protein product [Cuscuta europaea]|uniref:Acid phosphatase n=1 Tax=Cuscuta europaea TaxID=41803 RepID=A0A9P0ZEZ8_CUSEU|nr:unnamed protein product [Cuscuta europaea]
MIPSYNMRRCSLPPLAALLFLLATYAKSSHAHSSANQFHRLRPLAASGRLNCHSWRLGVETNNIRDWSMVPLQCEDYVGHYMLGHQYRDDCISVTVAAIQYAKTVAVKAVGGKDIWVFDIDETTLSNLPYYARSDVAFGEGKAPGVPGMVRLYRTLTAMGIKAVFLSGTKEEFRKVRVTNLKNAGYTKWEMLILKGANETGTSEEYKSKQRTELVKKGYRIIGNIGDQWSDLVGDNGGLRTFKLPDPMYYIA